MDGFLPNVDEARAARSAMPGTLDEPPPGFKIAGNTNGRGGGGMSAGVTVVASAGLSLFCELFCGLSDALGFAGCEPRSLRDSKAMLASKPWALRLSCINSSASFLPAELRALAPSEAISPKTE
jgi:hypothetical protein